MPFSHCGYCRFTTNTLNGKCIYCQHVFVTALCWGIKNTVLITNNKVIALNNNIIVEINR